MSNLEELESDLRYHRQKAIEIQNKIAEIQNLEWAKSSTFPFENYAYSVEFLEAAGRAMGITKT